jgi:hypothetical protein
LVPHSPFHVCGLIIAMGEPVLTLIRVISCSCACAGRSPLWILTGSTRLCISSRVAARGDALFIPCS